MARLLVFLFPALIDLALSSAFFVCTVRLAEAGWSPLGVTGVLTCWAAVYVVICPWVGRYVTATNAWQWLTGSASLIALTCWTFALIEPVWVNYLFTALLGITTAGFFISFQVFMKTMGDGHQQSLSKSIGLYTFSWSMGMAMGPFVSGYLWEWTSWQNCYVISGIVAMVTGIGIFLLRHHGKPQAVEEEPDTSYAQLPDLIRLGWIAGGVAFLAVGIVRGVFPSSGLLYQISKSDQGIVLGLFCLSQAFTGLVLVRSQRWMYRVIPIMAFTLVGMGSLVLFSWADRLWLFELASLGFGVYTGATAFYFVFHALSHPIHSARYVSINETVVGAAGIGGPLLGGIIANLVGFTASYLTAAALACFAATWLYRKHRSYQNAMMKNPANHDEILSSQRTTNAP